MPATAQGVLLAGHVAAGVAALALGPLAVLGQRNGRGRALWTAYGLAVTAVTVSALGLVALDPARLWWLIPFAVGTQAAIIGAWWLRRRHTSGWTPALVRLVAGSYVSLVTALLVVSWGSPLAWVLPTVAGIAVIETAAVRVGRSG